MDSLHQRSAQAEKRKGKDHKVAPDVLSHKKGSSLIYRKNPSIGYIIAIEMERFFELSSTNCWNWHKNWNIPKLTVSINVGLSLTL